ncbi:MAG: 6-pyruvoyl trahydropterin synthase family protein, partial [bacterium]
ARVEIECRGPIDGLGMVVDFSSIKERVEAWILANWDHRMILRRTDPLAAALRALGEPVYELEGAPTAENLAAILFRVAKEAGLPVTAVRFWETDASVALFEGA